MIRRTERPDYQKPSPSMGEGWVGVAVVSDCAFFANSTRPLALPIAGTEN